jgi:hypothetical protein
MSFSAYIAQSSGDEVSPAPLNIRYTRQAVYDAVIIDLARENAGDEENGHLPISSLWRCAAICT